MTSGRSVKQHPTTPLPSLVCVTQNVSSKGRVSKSFLAIKGSTDFVGGSVEAGKHESGLESNYIEICVRVRDFSFSSFPN